KVDVCRWLAYRVAWLQKNGMEVSYQASMSKIFGSELMQDIGQYAMELLGLYAQLLPESKWAPLHGDIEKWFLGNLGRTIGGGTSEIQRNLIATRGLGLPNA
ncbi:acyl-CoA dehydrogenase family protein, partial [Chloroflexota bacterium]